MADGSPLPVSLCELLDPAGYWHQAAAKQHEMGIACAGYAELVRINSFLADCRSVHVLLRDGRDFALTTGCFITAGDLFTCDNRSGQLELKDNSNFDPRPYEAIPIEEVACLKHDGKTLDLDTGAIQALFELPTQAMEQDGLMQKI